MNIIEELKKLGVEVTEEVEKKFNGEFVSKAEMDKKVSKAENERDELKERLTTAEETLKGFEGKDFDAMQTELDTWKAKAKEAEETYNKKLAENEKSELLKEAFKDIEFTSESAKKAIINQISNDITVKNGKLIGFNELLEEAKASDAGAFVDKETQKLEAGKATFTQPIKQNAGGNETKEAVRNAYKNEKDASKRQQMIADHPEFF